MASREGLEKWAPQQREEQAQEGWRGPCSSQDRVHGSTPVEISGGFYDVLAGPGTGVQQEGVRLGESVQLRHRQARPHQLPPLYGCLPTAPSLYQAERGWMQGVLVDSVGHPRGTCALSPLHNLIWLERKFRGQKKGCQGPPKTLPGLTSRAEKDRSRAGLQLSAWDPRPLRAAQAPIKKSKPVFSKSSQSLWNAPEMPANNWDLRA